ncbi:uncharacterized protein At1g76070-like [Lotus japonicus]|uniref:uncharacterized protein At1g76070-like n=1 Tax=Lotus japonicus TaxID=34305 RepID=UPI002588A6A7|nr:uncharacterized protein At1g76070-like [Lotus japonicus]
MMEKLSQIKTKFFNFKILIQQPAASLAFHNPSPCLSPKHNVSIIPKEARRKHRGGSFSASREPSSPRVSCMGQVQGKKKNKKRKAQNCKRVQQPPVKDNDPVPVRCAEKNILLLISKGSDEGRKQSGKALVLEEKAPIVPPTMDAPSLGMMKKLASGRGSLYDFDVTLAER